MTTIAERAAEAEARQRQWEHDLTAILEPHIVRFLRSVIQEAMQALDAPILLAAGDPFAFTNIRKRWDTAVRLILNTPAGRLAHPALLDDTIAGVLRAADLPDRAASLATDVLIRGRDEDWTPAKTKRELRLVILPPAPKVQGPKAESTEWAWYKASVRRIARTAATRANSLYTLADAAGKRKRWVTARDAKVRTAHAEAHGQTVPEQSPFAVGGYPMMYPGDTSAPPELTENCRCVLVVIDQEETMPDPIPETIDPLAASGVPAVPPADWFDNPQLTGPTRLTVTDDGRVFGHIAEWDSCHTGYPGECVPPPRSPSNYAYFHNGVMRVQTAAGDIDRIRVGKITAATGHAGPEDSPIRALAHYDNTGTTAAYLRAGEDAFGIWVAGVVAAGATPEQVSTLEAHPPSGDWRNMGQGLDLLAILCVNTPGFPVQLVASSDAGEPVSLVAAGRLPERDLVALPSDELEFVRGMMRADQARELVASVTGARVRARVDRFAAERRKERGRHGMSVQRQ